MAGSRSDRSRELDNSLLRRAEDAIEQRASAARDERERATVVRRERAAAVQEELANPGAEVEQMRAVGQTFVRAMEGRGSKVRDFFSQYAEQRLTPTSHTISTLGDAEERRLGWTVGRHGRDSVVVLDDGRVGHPASNHREHWEDLPWSEELEDSLVDWLAEHVLEEPTAIGALLRKIKLWFLRHRGIVAVAGIAVVAAGIAYPPFLTIAAYPVIIIATALIILWGLDLIAFAVPPGKSS